MAPGSRREPPVIVMAPVVADAGVTRAEAVSPLAAYWVNMLPGYSTALTWPK